VRREHVGQRRQPALPPPTPSTIAEILRDVEPMGDLGRFVIEDMTSDEEDEFFAVLEDT
jgi:hypothetical protein